jgi:hypothetical protein
MSDWIENELRRQMRPVAAPESLWDRIQNPSASSPAIRVEAKNPLRPLWFLSVCAATLVLLTAGLLWGIRQSRPHLRDIALTDQDLRVLADLSTGETFSSANPVHIRNWVKSRSNIDVELPSGRSEAIHLLGAKLIQLHGSLIAAVAYKVGDDPATLLVSRRGLCCNTDVGSRHLIAKAETSGGTSLTSWKMRDQEYTIAYAGAGEPQGACQLCHAEAHSRL